MPAFVRRVPEGDNRDRLVCPECGFVAYENPKVVVGSVVVEDSAVLMCRRAIEPRRGFWTLPAGFMELGETIEEGTIREVWEEARARVVLEGILGVFSVSRIGQVQIIFRARFVDGPVFSAGPETLEVGLFGWEEIPWGSIAFPTVRWSLHAWRASGAGPLGRPWGNPAEDPRGMRRLNGLAW
jgi:ADP-ribose pyrophosphatase YjhB (NUDIX family)